MPIRWWLEQILIAAASDAELAHVPEHVLPPDLTITAAPAQHLLVSVVRAQALLGWEPDEPATRVAQSVRWHLQHAPDGPTWSKKDTRTDEAALAAAP